MAGLGIFDYLSNLNQQAMGGPLAATPPGAPTALRSVSDFLTNNPALVSNLAYSIGNAPSLRQGVINVGRGMPDAMNADKQSQMAAQQKAAVAQYLNDPNTAKAYQPGQLQFLKALPPDVAAKYIGTQMFPPANAKSSDIQEYEYAKAQGYTGTFQDYILKVKGASQAQENYYGTPVITQDGQGNVTGAYIYSNRGNVQPLKIGEGGPGAPGTQTTTSPTGDLAEGGPPNVNGLPQGTFIKPQGSAKTVDAGTSQVVIGPTGAIVRTIPKDVAGTAAANQYGQAGGTAAANLPSILNSSQRLVDAIDTFSADPALDSVIGRFMPLGIPKGMQPTMNDDMARARAEIDQILGGTFLQAYNDLRGAGQISNAEGQSAKAAYNKLQNTDMSAKDYRAALQEFKVQVQKLMAIAQQRATMGTQSLPQTGPAVPAAGANNDPLGLR